MKTVELCDVQEEFLNDTLDLTLSYKDDPELENLRIFEQTSCETRIALIELQEYRGIRKGQSFQLEYGELCRKEGKTLNGLGLRFSETIVSGIENWLSRFYERYAKYNWNIGKEILYLKVSFILRDRGRTKVYFEFAR